MKTTINKQKILTKQNKGIKIMETNKLCPFRKEIVTYKGSHIHKDRATEEFLLCTSDCKAYHNGECLRMRPDTVKVEVIVPKGLDIDILNRMSIDVRP